MAVAAANRLRLGLCQVKVGADKQENLRNAAASVAAVVRKGAEVVLLPEMFNCPYANASFPKYAEEIPFNFDGTPSGELNLAEHNSSAFLQNLAQEHKVFLVGGSIPERQGDKLFNTSIVFNPQGTCLVKHRKVHLFDIDVPGKITFRESDTLSPGSNVSTFDTPWGKMGLGICYDMRFPEYALKCASLGCTFLLYPGAFNTTTGPAHWELLQRGRALDNQCFVAACAPARSENPNDYQGWGHSTVVGPWGDVLGSLDHTAGELVVDLDVDTVATTRRSIPILTQKRPDIYGRIGDAAAPTQASAQQ